MSETKSIMVYDDNSSQKRMYHTRFYNRERFWIGYCDEIPGALTQGETFEEAVENMKEAIQMMLEPIDELEESELAPVKKVFVV